MNGRDAYCFISHCTHGSGVFELLVCIPFPHRAISEMSIKLTLYDKSTPRFPRAGYVPISIAHSHSILKIPPAETNQSPGASIHPRLPSSSRARCPDGARLASAAFTTRLSPVLHPCFTHGPSVRAAEDCDSIGRAPRRLFWH